MMFHSVVEALDAYEKRFHENFPYFILRPSDEELLQLVAQALKAGKPLRPEMKDDVYY